MIKRPRRLRKTDAIRKFVRETHFSKKSLILPFFIVEGNGVKSEISTLDGHFHYSPDRICEGIGEALECGINSFLLFGIPNEKDEIGSSAWNSNGALQNAVRTIKSTFPDVVVITDVCMCEYTSHGHCGAISDGYVDNDKSIELLCKTALSHAVAGADIVAPSDMMDGRVAAIRNALDREGYIDIPIMSYSAKYSSAFYGPFREAAGSAPSFGDRKSYQMDYHNINEAIYESSLDIEEGADMIMVKPALSYLDVIRETKNNFGLPLAAYSVSGEYAMIKAAAKAGLVDEYSIMCETTTSIFRAGADILITYYAKEIAKALDRGDIG